MGLYLLVTGDFRRTGGMDMANFALADYLTRRGDEVHLVTHLADEELSDRPNVTVHRVPKPAGSYLLAAPLLNRVGQREAKRIAKRGGRVIVNGGNCRYGDVNWVHYVHAAYHPTIATGTLRRLKGEFNHRRNRRNERAALGRANVIIANSERTRRDVIDRLQVSESRVHTIYYGIDPTRFGAITGEQRAEARAHFGWEANRPLVAFIGALGDRRKGFDTLAAAWMRLCDEPSWDADLVVVGAGGELPVWKERAARANRADRFHFLGFSREVPRVLAACDALVHPVRYEAYGLGVHEALCRGLPAIVSDSAGVAERYADDLRNLLLPDPTDAGELAARLLAWRQSRDVYRDRMASVSAQLRAITWDDMARSIVKLLDHDN